MKSFTLFLFAVAFLAAAQPTPAEACERTRMRAAVKAPITAVRKVVRALCNR